MAVFLAPLAPIAKAGLLRGGAYLANKFLRKKAKEQIKKKFAASVPLKRSLGIRVPIAGGRIPPRTGASYRVPIAGGRMPPRTGSSFRPPKPMLPKVFKYGTRGAAFEMMTNIDTPIGYEELFRSSEVQAPTLDDFFKLNQLREQLDNKKRLEDILAGKKVNKK